MTGLNKRTSMQLMITTAITKLRSPKKAATTAQAVEININMPEKGRITAAPANTNDAMANPSFTVPPRN
jgi:hypothetical protein